METGPLFFLLKWTSWLPASEEYRLLGAVVKDYRKPTDNRTPATPLVHNHYSLIKMEFMNFVVRTHNNDSHEVEVGLSSLAGIRFGGHTNQAANLTGKLFTIKRLQQHDEFWDNLQTSESVQAKVPAWVSNRKRGKNPICVVVGIIIAQDVEVSLGEKSFTERSARGEIPIGAISMASGVPLPIGIEADLKARVKADKDVGAIFKAKSAKSNIIALEVKPLTSRFWNRERLIMKDEPPTDVGQQLGDDGDDDDEDEEDPVLLEDLVVGDFFPGDLVDPED